MAVLEFLTVSGAVAWAYIAWRGYQTMRSAGRRLRWAVWGHRHKLQKRGWLTSNTGPMGFERRDPAWGARSRRYFDAIGP
jgi:hypothetical protein